MYSGNIVQRFLQAFQCWIGHDAEGPIEGVAFEISPGKYHPYYQCRRCHRMLKWKLDGGWEAEG